ncbi:hypothetical protein P7K49_038564 [Saguinus oedipus]|uniref:Uncharacterized protein n=1 Tax=Saguinus oedipus TaxID=9490 RepID=A0ABQ9TF11_SAGOE|nr:hypothetical protein P7K49_038564 [Saguinus oedipus]
MAHTTVKELKNSGSAPVDLDLYSVNMESVGLRPQVGTPESRQYSKTGASVPEGQIGVLWQLDLKQAELQQSGKQFVNPFPNGGDPSLGSVSKPSKCYYLDLVPRSPQEKDSRNQEISGGGAPQVASTTLVAGVVVLLAQWCSSSWYRVNRTGSPFGRHLELREGRVTYSAD